MRNKKRIRWLTHQTIHHQFLLNGKLSIRDFKIWYEILDLYMQAKLNIK